MEEVESARSNLLAEGAEFLELLPTVDFSSASISSEQGLISLKNGSLVGVFRRLASTSSAVK